MTDPTSLDPAISALSPGDPRPFEHAQEWQRHVDASRIGGGPGATGKQLATHVRNAIALLRRRY